MAPRRPDLYVVARFLDRLGDGERWTHARLQTAVRLNYDLYLWYLGWLTEKGFAAEEEVDGRAIVAITAAGRNARTELCGWIGRVLGASILDRRREGPKP